jgi:hypothetical protein
VRRIFVEKLIQMNKKISVIILFVSLLVIGGCGHRSAAEVNDAVSTGTNDAVSNVQVQGNNVPNAAGSPVSASDPDAQHVAYIVADHYFVNNTVKDFTSHKITDSKEFDTIFGMGAVMGKNGEPTSINFKTQYVIAIVKPETDHTTTLTPVSLVKNKNGKLLFTYRCETGAKQSYTIRPCLIIIVDKAHDGDVFIKEIQ